MTKLWQLLRSLILNTFRVVLALLILFEEWGWEPISRLMARIGSLPVFRSRVILASPVSGCMELIAIVLHIAALSRLNLRQ